MDGNVHLSGCIVDGQSLNSAQCTPRSSLQVEGGVTASTGDPLAGSTTSNVGYAFNAPATTGMFASSSGASSAAATASVASVKSPNGLESARIGSSGGSAMAGWNARVATGISQICSYVHTE